MTTPSDVILGVDIGSSSIKAAALTSGDQVLVTSTAALTPVRAAGGRVEQDMNAVWDAVAHVIRDITGTVGVAPSLVGVTGQGDGAWFVDAKHRPTGPAVSWMDGRAAPIVRRWQDDGRAELVESTTRSVLFPGALPPLAEWYRDTEPDVLRSARWHLNAKDWVGLRLTGVAATDPTEAGRVAFPIAWWLAGRLEYDHGLLSALGIDFLSELLPPIRASHDIRGEVSSSAAEATGLAAGTPVIVGALDGPACAVGMGVSEVGDGYAILGTTASYGLLSNNPPRETPPPGICVPGLRTDRVYSSIAPASGAPTLAWARAMIAPGADMTEFEQLARTSAPGSNGALLLPHLATGGERGPFVSQTIRGSLHGLSLDTRPGDIARAAYEGIVLLMAECFDALPPVNQLTLGGGAARSPLLAQTAADVLGIPVRASTTRELGVQGIIGIASRTVGLAAHARAQGQWYHPDPSTRDVYLALRATARATRQASRELADQAQRDSPRTHE